MPSYLKIIENELINNACAQINADIDTYVQLINEMVTDYSTRNESERDSVW